MTIKPEDIFGQTLPVSSAFLGFKNKFINGNFDIWQRGTSYTSTTGHKFLADRWKLLSSGSSHAVSRQTFTSGQTDVPGNPSYFHRTVVTSSAGAANFIGLAQMIEGVKTFAGEEVILSFYAKADASKNIAIEFLQNFGSGGTPSTTVRSIGAQKIALTTSWQEFTVTVSVPSISGKTLGTDGDDYLQLTFWMDAGSNLNAYTDTLGQQSGTFDIAQVQVEKGSSATEFEQRPIGVELALCQRYYWQGYSHLGGMVGYLYASGGSAVMLGASLVFPVQMRVNPTVSLTNTATYTNCSHLDFVTQLIGAVHRVNVSATGRYRVNGGIYAADAEL